MEEYSFEDALAKTLITCDYPGLQAVRSTRLDSAKDCTSLFFPGCSFINYSVPLVKAVYDLLLTAGSVDGISLLCCGKILEYEPNAQQVCGSFQQEFRKRIAQTNITRIVAACPNCVAALRKLLAVEETTASIEVVPLATELAKLGYRVDAEVASGVARQDPRITEEEQPVFCVKDSCPDRETGEFADGLRAIMENCKVVEPQHNRKSSICCGSRPRAAGRMDASVKSCNINHDEAQAAGANAIVTSCMSCTFLLSLLQPRLPVFHYLELLFDYRIPWEYADQYMKLRFLFDDVSSQREYYVLDQQED